MNEEEIRAIVRDELAQNATHYDASRLRALVTLAGAFFGSAAVAVIVEVLRRM